VADKRRTKTARKKLFARELLKSGDPKFAHLKSHPGSTLLEKNLDEKVSSEITDPVVVKEITKIWRSQGLTLELATQKHLAILSGKGKKVKGADVLKAVEMVYKGHKVPGFGNRDEPGDGRGILQIFIDQRRERGLPLPEGIQDAEVVG